MPLQPVHITHERCGDYGEYTYALAPADWTPEEVHAAVDAAQESYLAALAAIKTAGDAPPTPPYQPNYEAYPDLTVAEVMAAHEEAKTKFNQWKKKAQPQSRRFEDFLEEHGLIQPWNHWDHDGILSVTVFWGHNHGARYQYGDEDGIYDTFPLVTEYTDGEA